MTTLTTSNARVAAACCQYLIQHNPWSDGIAAAVASLDGTHAAALRCESLILQEIASKPARQVERVTDLLMHADGSISSTAIAQALDGDASFPADFGDRLTAIRLVLAGLVATPPAGMTIRVSGRGHETRYTLLDQHSEREV